MEKLDRQRKAVELRIMGLTYRQIAEKLGYKSTSSVQKALQAAIRKTLQEPTDELRAMESAKLDFIWKGMLSNLQADKLDYKAWEMLLRVMNRRAALLGLDMPARREISGPDGGPLRIDWRAQLASALGDDRAADALDKLAEAIDDGGADDASGG